ncbi:MULTISPECIES: glutamine-hydrolyzing GMP synthase [Acidiplasma]|jgi:GMP synthase (glutamine-hydrolysing)|nr:MULTISPECIES: glutamine-hydrolyzing GMP synthase [unclassified Acidiplasma]KJE48903.1 GMP synthase [glutamine-hydrolyzing] subunit B [Acidiplasma sp. MBA-1]WMT54311.1 MAG: glutamine-hydrolyzing GMP synthase [Acidiplasma sp.]
MVKPEQFIEDAKLHIKSQLKGKGILACSGGQDSTLLSVIAGMVSRDILVIFVDTGLLRLHEVENAEKIFKKYNINYKIIDARQRFIQNLKGITDPEQKRKIVGKTFIDVFEEAAKDFGAEYLLQGTIAPDWIESGGQSRDTIKSHHNVGGLPENMKLKLIEPLRDLYKDEVREVSKYLGIPEIMPFPGPGLSIRIIGEVTEEKLDLIRKATDIVERNVMENMHERPWQYFAVLLPVNTTGVHGDQRSYGKTVAIRFIDTLDGMTGTFSRPDWNLLEKISTEITDEIPEINRVVYDITNKPPATIEWE